jgi:CDP-4-dehydro-6-deoxyglucose reductase
VVPYIVHIKPNDLILMVNPGETVLEAALRQGFSFPFNCQNAVCGTCMGRVLRGKIEYSNGAEEELCEEEKEEGYAFFCSARPQSDLVIEISGVEAPKIDPGQTAAYVLKSHSALSPNTSLLELYPQKKEEALPFRSGQYVYLLQDEESHAYSIANAADDSQRIELHIRHTQENAFAEKMLSKASEGKPLLLSGAHGHCVLHHQPPVPTILLAAGTGFAQMKALIEEALSLSLESPIYLYWGARKREDLYAHELALEWAKRYPFIHYHAMLSAPDAGTWSGDVGYIYEYVVKQHADLSNFQVYASGPPDMVFAALRLFEQHGLKRDFMYSDMLLGK